MTDVDAVAYTWPEYDGFSKTTVAYTAARALPGTTNEYDFFGALDECLKHASAMAPVPTTTYPLKSVVAFSVHARPTHASEAVAVSDCLRG